MISEPFGLFKTVYETIYSIRLRERINSLKPSTNAVNMSRNRSTPCTPKTLEITSHQHPYKTVSNQGRQTNITNLGLADQLEKSSENLYPAKTATAESRAGSSSERSDKLPRKVPNTLSKVCRKLMRPHSIQTSKIAKVRRTHIESDQKRLEKTD